ncbi:MAG: ABC transporter ATP-binding protein [Candidatus Diapherotrites archaeon]|nr:ABC transporter ATP-binding protein [Candidatus Diapherotrites archaeon]
MTTKKGHEVILETKNLRKEYDLGETKVKALSGVSLKIYEGEFVVVLGPSGSGKSTLLHLLGALDAPTKGRVLVDGRDISKFSPFQLSMLRRKIMGFIFQSFNLIPTLNALENVKIPLEPTPLSGFEASKRAKKLLKEVELEHRIFHKPNQLSGGERQRVSIARSLVNDPEIIFADEPTGNLDSVTGDKVLEIMKHLNEVEGRTFVVVTHDPALVNFADQVFYIRDGKIEKVVERKKKKSGRHAHGKRKVRRAKNK